MLQITPTNGNQFTFHICQSSISLTGRQLLTASAGVPGQLVVHGQHHRQQSPRHTRNDQAMVTLVGQIDWNYCLIVPPLRVRGPTERAGARLLQEKKAGGVGVGGASMLWRERKEWRRGLDNGAELPWIGQRLMTRLGLQPIQRHVPPTDPAWQWPHQQFLRENWKNRKPGMWTVALLNCCKSG